MNGGRRPLAAALALVLGISCVGCGGSSAPVAAPPNVAALPGLIQSLKARKPDARARAAVSIGRMGPAAAEAVPALRAALKDRDVAVKAAAAHALGKIGPEARSALPDLEALASRSALSVTVATSIREIGQ